MNLATINKHCKSMEADTQSNGTSQFNSDHNIPSLTTCPPPVHNGKGEGGSNDDHKDAESTDVVEKSDTENTTIASIGLNGEEGSTKQLCSDTCNAISATEVSDIEQESETQNYGDSGVATKQKSVLKHIMSQIRVGMDLTRITLPAFLLAPHSMLQMYANLFGRPYMITDVADQPTPSGRMIAVVKWFLGSLSSSRKDPSPKKPYNPILGETFSCYWDLPESKSSTESDKERTLVDTGPFPQAGHTSFCFQAEQVSHHPPISAVYGECASKKMYIAATIGSKTKLTSSLAVKAHNTGLFRICLLEYEEEYVTVLPDGYVRSVLKTPWFEFGGQCVVTCAKSGHSAKIIFHTKPKVSKHGKKNRVSGELICTSNKKPYMTFEGEWDSVVHSKTSEGQPEVLFDASSPTFPKSMKKTSCTDPTDSRVVWKQLTEALLLDDEQAAGEAKHQIEEIQREKAKDRSRTGQEFQQQHFHQSKDDPLIWEYNNPLNLRLASHT